MSNGNDDFDALSARVDRICLVMDKLVCTLDHEQAELRLAVEKLNRRVGVKSVMAVEVPSDWTRGDTISLCISITVIFVMGWAVGLMMAAHQ